MNIETDVCLILEGTYPYVPGGVSSWVHQLITSLDEFTYSLVVILPDHDATRTPKYDIPDHVKELKEIYLHDLDIPESCMETSQTPELAWEDMTAFHECPFNKSKITAFQSIYKSFFNSKTRETPPKSLADTKEAWNLICRLYENYAQDESFLDYFWTFRFIHYPLFKMLTTDLPKASVYHTVSTGYAGFLGVVAKLQYRRPLLLTEHGIYTRERQIEISRADWIYEKEDHQIRVRHSQSRFKNLWNRMFGTLSKICYVYSDEIITLSKGNQQYQLADGAAPQKMSIIPNGVDVKTLMKLKKEKKQDPEEFVVGFMGRVVSIKDVKTFIRACKGVAEQVAKLKVYIMGPTEEEKSYYEDCVKLTEFLGLKKIITFTGKINIQEYYPKIDVLVLTSISEAQPLVILEAYCLGIPAVATDVGACRELLYGSTEEDIMLGQSGFIAGVSDSKAIAQAIIKILKSEKLRQEMSVTAKKRVAKFYNKVDLDNRYRKIYEQYVSLESSSIDKQPMILTNPEIEDERHMSQKYYSYHRIMRLPGSR
ncbi:MAG: GT4 family glycosyltransferase PelF [bacterium]